MTDKIQLIDILTKNREIFFYFVNVCNETYRSGHELKYYRQIIELHRSRKNLNSLLTDKDIYPLLHKTLEKFNMNQRGAKLASIETIRTSILSQRDNLIKLYDYQLQKVTKGQISSEILPLISETFNNLNIMKSAGRLVGVSKTLHFLLPDLIIPIDNKYTLSFFNKSTKDKEYDTFEDVFMKTYRISHDLLLQEDDFNGEGWNTSIPKLIDNAIIGFYRFTEVNSLETVLSKLEELVKLDSQEYHLVQGLLQDHYDRLPIRREAKKKILIEKAIQAGITVSDEEIKAEMAKRNMSNNALQ